MLHPLRDGSATAIRHCRTPSPRAYPGTVWREGYDDYEKACHAAGITNGRVFRGAEDPNDVLILQDVADVAKARTWLGGDELKAAMTKAAL
jgi:hypothetical protein